MWGRLPSPRIPSSTISGRASTTAQGDAGALIDPAACRNYAANARANLAKRIAFEKAQ
jgi:hypothetical protein